MRKALILVLGLAAPAACRGPMSTSQQALTETLHPGGVSPRTLTVQPGARLRFLNDDLRLHEIYSNDCGALASTPIAPGQEFIVQLDQGPRTCHFQDLLAPAAEEFWGTVKVTDPPPAAYTDPV